MKHSNSSSARKKRRNMIIAFGLFKAVKIAIVIGAAMFTSSAASAAGGIVKGTLVDAADASPLPDATLRFYLYPDTTKMISGIATDADGKFTATLASAGKYLLKCTYVGMNDRNIEFTLTDFDKSLDLGVIPMRADSEMLSEVTVIGRRPIIQADGEKLTYNTEDDISTSSQTAIEMLRKVPTVTVDGDDNIRLNGNGNFKILLNGREDPMLSSNASQVLKSMPANTIKKVEIITDPGAKFDAEGVGGILNIITTKNMKSEGYTGSVTLMGNNRNAGLSASLLNKFNKVTTNLNLSAYYMWGHKGNSDTDRENFTSEQERFHLQRGTNKQRGEMLQGSFQISYEADTLNLFTASFTGYGVMGDATINTAISNYNAANILTSSYKTAISGNGSWGSLSAYGAYQHTFRNNSEHNLILSYQYNYGIYMMDYKNSFYDPFNYDMLSPAEHKKDSTPTNEHTVQIDYCNPFTEHHKLEAGFKGIFRRNNAGSEASQGADLASIPEMQWVSKVRQTQNIEAVYASYSFKWSKLAAKAGLRYEHTDMGLRYLIGGTETFNSSLNDVVPNASLTLQFSPARMLRASYQMRIMRPSINQMNPHGTEIIPGNVNIGNPDLTSERNHNVTLTYSDFGKMLGTNLSAGYSQSTNMISDFSWMSNNTLYSSYANLGTYRQFFANAYLLVNFSPKMQLSVNGGAQYTDLRSPSANAVNCGWAGNIGGTFSYTMPWRLKLEAYGGWGSRSISLQGEGSSWNYCGISLQRSFLSEDRLKVSISASNFIQPKTHWRTSLESDNFRQTTDYSMSHWMIGASVSFNFGSLKSRMKSVSTTIVNDDVQQSNSNKGFGGNGGL